MPAAGDDVDYLLDAVNEFFATELAAADLTGAYAGVRPLISTGDPKKSVDISRKAELYETSSGMITITGGKLTTWRRMAKMAVDRIVEREGREAPCRTARDPAGHAGSTPASWTRRRGRGRRAARHLAGRYGHAAVDVLRMADGGPELAERIVPDLPDLLAEAPFAARREQARVGGGRAAAPHPAGPAGRAHALRARTRPAARRVAEAMAAELGWDAARVEAELELWARVSAPEGLRARRARVRAGMRLALGQRDAGAGAGGAAGHGHRERHARLVLGSPGPEGPGRAGRARAARWSTRGAHIIDVGGESGRTDAAAVSEAEEAERVVPLVRAAGGRGDRRVGGHLARRAGARRRWPPGAAMLNDVSGLADPALADAVRASRARRW